MGEKCQLCWKELAKGEVRIHLKQKDGSTKAWCADCFACSVCTAKPVAGSKFALVPMGLSAVTLCDSHHAKYERYRGKGLDDLPDELLGAQVNRMTYLRGLDERHANEVLRSGANPGKLNAAGQVLDIISGNYEGANWWQLDTMKKGQMSNNRYQMHMNGVAKLDAQIAQVREVMARRKQAVGASPSDALEF